MNYTSFADLADTIRKNLWKIPADIDLIVGVPRSGMIAAYILSEFMNIPVTDIDSFLTGRIAQSGRRGSLMRSNATNKILVIDDTVFNGTSMAYVRDILSHIKGKNIIYACVYAEGKFAKEKVDIFLDDNYCEDEYFCHLYEWNILHHGAELSEYCMFDMDGVLCKEPPDERQTEAYEQYIKEAIPMIIPSTKIGAIVTYRFERYRKETEEWLHKVGIEYGQLIMFNRSRNEESAASYKARIYRDAHCAKLFVESEDDQAEKISRLSGKQVFCYENGKMI